VSVGGIVEVVVVVVVEVVVVVVVEVVVVVVVEVVVVGAAVIVGAAVVVGATVVVLGATDVVVGATVSETPPQAEANKNKQTTVPNFLILTSLTCHYMNHSLRASLDWQLLNKQNCIKIIDKIENTKMKKRRNTKCE